MNTGTIKDYIDIGSAFVALLFFLIGTYWYFHYKIKSHDKRICDIESQCKDHQKYYRSVDRKLLIIERNLVAVMGKLKVKPVRELLEDKGGEE